MGDEGEKVSTDAKAKNKMTDEERLELAAKLDKDLDDFINSLPKRKQQDKGPMDESWVEELENHPFFMKKAPEPGEKLHPLYEGLQKLKYDPEENEPKELAINYKEDGNFNFKHKNYRLAILAYTEGIKVKCDDPETNAILYNNRAASHFFLKNYRSCLRDCELALKLKPGYEKALNRASNCCFNLKNYQKCIEFCDELINQELGGKEILELRSKCIKEEKLKLRNERKRDVETKKLNRLEDDLISEITNRGINIEGGIRMEKLEPCFPQLMHNRVFLDENNNLVWPVVFLYPEYKIMDYIQEFNEKISFKDQIAVMFETRPEWDERGEYKPEKLILYFEDQKRKLVTINLEDTLETVLKDKRFVVKAGTPSFLVLVKGSAAHKRFLDNY